MRLRTRWNIVPLALLLGFAAAGCGDDDSGGGATGDEASGNGAGDSVTVQVDDNVFEPEAVEVGVGGTVTWEWVGNEPHNVSHDDFSSDIQQAGTFEHTFAEAGTFDYVCTVHPGMEGTVEVSA